MSLSLLSLLFSLSAFAWEARDPQLVRVLDGKNVPCTARHEVGKVTFTPRALSLILDESSLSGQLEISVISCTLKGEEEFSLQPRLPLAPKDYLDLDGNQMRIEYRAPELFVGDEGYRGLTVVPLEDKAVQNLSFRVELERALSAAQRRDLADGKAVRARLVLVARRIGTLVRNGQNTPLGQEFLGSFTFFVTLKR